MIDINITLVVNERNTEKEKRQQSMSMPHFPIWLDMNEMVVILDLRSTNHIVPHTFIHV